MSGRLIRPTQSQQQPPQGQSFLGTLAQVPQGLAEGVAGLLGLPGTIQQMASPEEKARQAENFGGNTEAGYLPTSEQLVGGVRNIVKKILPEQYTKPQGFIEKTARSVGAGIPGAGLALATGGAALPVAASTLGSAVGETAAEELGLGSIGRIVSSVLGSTVGSYAARGATKGILKQLEPLREKSYKEAEKLGSKLLVETNPITKNLQSVEVAAKNNLSGPLYKKYYTQLKHDINNVNETIGKSNTVPINKIVDLKKKFNQIIYDPSTPDRAKNTFRDARNILNESINVIEKSHPEWGNSYRIGEDLTTFMKGSERFRDFFSRNKDAHNVLLSSSPELADMIFKAAKPSSASAAKSLMKAVGYPFKKAFQEVGNTQELLKNPSAQNLLGELWNGIAEDNSRAVISALSQLNNDIKPEIKSTGRGRLIRPSK